VHCSSMDGIYSCCRRIVLEKSIVISQAQKELLLNHASKSNPNESCAILFGKIENEKSMVKDVFLTENIDESPINFTISNEELLKAYKMAEEKNLDVVGKIIKPDKSILRKISDGSEATFQLKK